MEYVHCSMTAVGEYSFSVDGSPADGGLATGRWRLGVTTRDTLHHTRSTVPWLR